MTPLQHLSARFISGLVVLHEICPTDGVNLNAFGVVLCTSCAAGCRSASGFHSKARHLQGGILQAACRVLSECYCIWGLLTIMFVSSIMAVEPYFHRNIYSFNLGVPWSFPHG